MQIRINVQEFIDSNLPGTYLANSSVRSTVLKCQKAHNIAKEQVRLIESSQGMHEIATLCFLVLILTTNTFLTLGPIFRGDTLNKVRTTFNSVYLLVALLRLHMKCHYAEQISKQVNKVLKEIPGKFLNLIFCLHKEKLSAETLFSWELSDTPEVIFNVNI